MHAGDDDFYSQCAIMAIVQEEYEAYVTLMDSGQYEMALDSLIRGIGRYDKFYEQAEKYDILIEYNKLEEQIEQVLNAQFAVTADQARELYAIRQRDKYSLEIQKILDKLGLQQSNNSNQ